MASFDPTLPPQRLKARAKEHWTFWRLIFDGGIDYNTVWNQMTPAEVDEANAALDYMCELQNREREG